MQWCNHGRVPGSLRSPLEPREVSDAAGLDKRAREQSPRAAGLEKCVWSMILDELWRVIFHGFAALVYGFYTPAAVTMHRGA